VHHVHVSEKLEGRKNVGLQVGLVHRSGTLLFNQWPAVSCQWSVKKYKKKTRFVFNWRLTTDHWQL
jgi:hypothetical protein